MSPFLGNDPASVSSSGTSVTQKVGVLDSTPSDFELRKAALLDSIAAVTRHAQLLARDSQADKAARYELRSAALTLADSFESPVEQALRILFETQPPLTGMRIALEGSFVQPLAESAESMTAEELGANSGADPILIARIMRLLSAARMVDEVGVRTYRANDLTRAFNQPGISDAVRHGCDVVNIIFAKLPQFLTATNFKDPDSYGMGPHVFCFGKPLWKHLEMEPQQSAIFDRMMMAFKKNRESFIDIFPFPQRAHDLTPDQVLIVDIAGGIGHRVKDFRAKHANLPGRAILQDLPHVLPTEKSNPDVHADLVKHNIELMEHDIFTPQPIKGAKYYFFSAIFHGRPDANCVELLQNTASAMDKDSRILVNDFVLPDKDALLFHSAFDLWMMADVAGKERTLSQWEHLADAAGLRLAGVHRLGTDAVVEFALKDAA